jgi:alkylation response protein AidB-like acyl-CoA dehydrogenase
MDFQFTAEELKIRDRARKFAETELKPNAAKWDEEERDPGPMLRRAAEEGFVGLTLPKKYGGGGIGPLAAILVIEELSACCANTAEVVFDAMLGPSKVIEHFGTEKMRRELLPKAARGDYYVAIAISEPHAGSAATDMLSRARIEGDVVVLNGRKCYVEDIASMSSALVYIKFDDRPSSKSIGGVLVDKGTPGFTVGKPYKKMGVRGCIQADMIFDNCKVPKENIVVGPGDFGKLMSAFNLERCGNAAMSLGLAGGALREAISYAKSREQFGRPICEFQGLQWKIARMAMEYEAARLMVYRAVANASSGFPSVIETSMAKVYANEMAISVTTEALQIFGAQGYLRDRPLERMVRDARAWSIAGGTVEVQLTNIASELFGRRFSQRVPAAAQKN